MKQPNILVIVSDQLTWRALPCYGDTFAKTPNIDRIAKNAVIFDKTYTPFPLCAPARAAFWTSRYPHETHVLSNGRKYPFPNIPQDMPTLGEAFTKAGYEAVHFGKKHDLGSLRGFTCNDETGSLPCEDCAAWPAGMDSKADRYTTVECVKYLNERPASDTPYIMVADLINPHDICSWIGKNAFEHEDVPLPEGEELPELPDNFDFNDIENRPIGVQYICCSHNRQAMAAPWTRENYRHYLAAYYHYISVMDAEVGRILDALEARPDYDNTLIVFMADHGDGMTSRGHVTKQVNMYEEITRVPLMFTGAGVVNGGRHINDNCVSSLDLVPTLCDLAGIEGLPLMRGLSLAPYITGKGKIPEREYVVSTWTTEWGYTVSPGRMIRTNEYKYTKYTEDGAEELFDMLNDPMEKINQAKNPAYTQALDHMRALLADHIEKTNDDFYNVTPWAGKRWRSHKVGYKYHKGHAAPFVITALENEDLSNQ